MEREDGQLLISVNAGPLKKQKSHYLVGVDCRRHVQKAVGTIVDAEKERKVTGADTQSIQVRKREEFLPDQEGHSYLRRVDNEGSPYLRRSNRAVIDTESGGFINGTDGRYFNAGNNYLELREDGDKQDWKHGSSDQISSVIRNSLQTESCNDS